MAPADKREIEDDEGSVLAVASLLDVSEYEVFAMAYRRWYGTFADPRLLDRLFARYMFGSSVPAWVRHFAREVLSRERDGILDWADYGLEQPTPRVGSAWRGWVYLGVLGAVVATLIWAAHRAQGLFKADRSCYFPPCYRIVAPFDPRAASSAGGPHGRDFPNPQGEGIH